MNPLTIQCSGKRKFTECSEVDSGETSGGSDYKRRSYHRPDSADKINELKHKNFVIQSKKKIRWCVNMYEDWRQNRLLDPYVPSQIRTANLNSLKYIQCR